METLRPVPAYRRSAFQVAVLMFATLGLYVFVWAFFVRRACAAILEREDQAVWKTVALVIPIFNLFLMFELGKRIEGVQWRADSARTNAALPWIGISVFFFNVLGRLPGDYATFGTLGFVPIASLQRAFSRAQIALLGEAALPARFHWLEWVAIVLGGGFWLAGTVGIGTAASADFSPEARRWFGAAILAAVAGLIFFWNVSRRAVAEGLAMHANPSPDRVTPYV